MLLYLDLLKEVLYGKDTNTSEENNENGTKYRISSAKFEYPSSEAVSKLKSGFESFDKDVISNMSIKVFEDMPMESRKKVTELALANGFDFIRA